MIDNHYNPDVQQAIIGLADALCTNERETGRMSILIIKEVRFKAVFDSGKPLDNDIPINQILKSIQ